MTSEMIEDLANTDDDPFFEDLLRLIRNDKERKVLFL
jgi:hypothetical protein